MEAGAHVTGRPGFLHGGAIAGLLELAAFVALHDAIGLPETVRVKPINVTVDFRRGGRLVSTTARGQVLRLGRRIANVDASAFQLGSMSPIAVARMVFLIDTSTPQSGVRLP
ncbi:PaaI family thioesterase [Novosphingobium sp. FGD1]|uniref:PaaI family thioesterase n=1 Tax=Novosphingobium silvae TaxID=2692619 RepID=A0A7X4K8X7_9SPHN|nr:PaaI family thioesterase [Novosphingobium silvae]MYL99729.1 PaaI family thioesterase [Novosphingobium silvae]